jgi:Rrf2 family protein
MKITAQEEYGLRCALQLARHQGSLTIPEIAEEEGLSTAYVAKLLNLLRQGGVVTSLRGRSGGYTLDGGIGEISVAQVLTALGSQPWQATHCERHPGGMEVCVHASGCAIRSLWGILDSVVEELLRNVSLADLLDTESNAAGRFQLRRQGLLASAGLRPARK